MKSRFVFILLMVISSVSFGQSHLNVVTFTANKGKNMKMGASRYVVVPVTLANNTNNTLEYYSLSCSWWDVYKMDSKDLVWNGGYPCGKNTPVLLKILPHQSFKRELELKVRNSHAHEIKYRIGFDLIAGKHNNAYVMKAMAGKSNIIWSNTIQMHI